jgi:flavin reductase (DIM6/NTAB) family NADH-FMN oxidoreductase RutF
VYKTFNPKEQDLKTNYQLLISGIIPRPIALVSSLSVDGVGNLAPFSFYNGFSAQPPIVGFSPALGGRDAQPKDTLVNIRDTKEFTISMVSVNMSDQMLITSTAFKKNIDEFDKSGFTKRESSIVSPPHIHESPFIMECKLHDIIELGSLPGSGNLILGEVVYFHVCEDVYVNERIHPQKLNALSRLGYSWYSDYSNGLFEIKRPANSCIGFDGIPEILRKTDELTAKELSQLASANKRPNTLDNELINLDLIALIHKIKEYLSKASIDEAWVVVNEIERRNA